MSLYTTSKVASTQLGNTAIEHFGATPSGSGAETQASSLARIRRILAQGRVWLNGLLDKLPTQNATLADLGIGNFLSIRQAIYPPRKNQPTSPIHHGPRPRLSEGSRA